MDENRQNYDYLPLISTGMVELDRHLTPYSQVEGPTYGAPLRAMTHFFSADGSHLEVGRHYAENAAALGLRVDLMSSVDVTFEEGVRIVPFDLDALGSSAADLTVVEMMALPMGPRAKFSKALKELYKARRGLVFSTYGDGIRELKYYCRLRVEFSQEEQGLLEWNIVKSKINANQGSSGTEPSLRTEDRTARL